MQNCRELQLILINVSFRDFACYQFRHSPIESVRQIGDWGAIGQNRGVETAEHVVRKPQQRIARGLACESSTRIVCKLSLAIGEKSILRIVGGGEIRAGFIRLDDPVAVHIILITTEHSALFITYGGKATLKVIAVLERAQPPITSSLL